MTKQGEKIRFKYEEENYYNSDFSQKLYIYLSENDDKTILDFIKNELDEISTKKKERARIFNLNDDDFYEYLIINNDRYKRIIEESIDKNETKILIIRNSLENEKSFFKDPTIFDRKDRTDSAAKSDGITGAAPSSGGYPADHHCHQSFCYRTYRREIGRAALVSDRSRIH